MPFVTNPIAIIGETEAARMLEKKGFRIAERNWRMGHLEVDLIAENKREIVFAEVKARTSTFGNRMPEENVDEIKRRRMVAAANAYVKYRQIEKNVRFDIIGLLINPETQEITYRCHLENAFYPPTRTISQNSFSGSWRWRHHSHTISK
ncbi:MAG: YraN family protein [Paludibacteraceae bacterium]|nr:YraN family protein [Paludibacteraceae bacterium]